MNVGRNLSFPKQDLILMSVKIDLFGKDVRIKPQFILLANRPNVDIKRFESVHENRERRKMKICLLTEFIQIRQPAKGGR